MSLNAVYERDLLYPTDSIFEPGSVHVEVLNPNKNGKIPVIIETKTSHSPIRNINSIIRVMQGDIFDRILLDIKNSVNLYIKSNDELKSEFGDKKYIVVVFNGDRAEFLGVDEITL